MKKQPSTSSSVYVSGSQKRCLYLSIVYSKIAIIFATDDIKHFGNDIIADSVRRLTPEAKSFGANFVNQVKLKKKFNKGLNI